MEIFLNVVPILGIVALIFAAALASKVNRQDAGTERMKEIAASISEGAQAFLTAEYKILIFFVLVLFVLIGVGIGNWVTAVCFVVGAVFSTLAGYFGMTVATKANVRTANAAKESGMNKALSIAFSGGAVMGMCVAGLGVFGVSAIYIFTGNADILFGFSLGASSIALFARVGGGIYTKAADVGADLVGKVEAGIPEDDPRNPAVIADNVGDNVGDVAGMGADLFESYVGALISALTLGFVYFEGAGAAFPLVIAGIGLAASILGTFFVRGDEKSNPHKALKTGSYAASVLVLIASFVLSNMFFGNFNAAIAIVSGLVVGILIGIITEVYTSGDYGSVKEIASQSETGPATTTISGIAVGMRSTAAPILLICAGIFAAYNFCGLYGIALAAVGVLCVAAGLPMTTYQLFTGGTMVADVEMSGPNRHIYFDLRNAFPEDPLVLEDGRLWLVLNGERTDITDRIDMETPYIVEHTDPETGLSSSLILGGTSEDFGWCLWQELPNQGGYSAYGYNYRATHFVYDGVSYEVPYGDNLDESLLSKENDWEDVKIVWQPWCEKGEQEAQVFARNR